MLSAVVLHLRPVAEIKLPISHGAFAYAAALDLLLRLDPALTHSLHEPTRHKPFTVSPVMAADQRDKFAYILSPERVYTWRLTGLTAAVSQQLLRLSPDLGGIRLGEAIFAIAQVSTTPKEHPEVGQATYEELLARWGKERPPSLVTLHFVTPTTFRTGRFEQPLPLPRWVFGSLLSTWNAFASHPLGELQDKLLDDLEEAVVLSNWRGETRRVEMGDQRTVGFVGTFTYRVVQPSPELSRLLGLLAEFAFYAGVGWQTTHGLGQVRPQWPR